MIWFYLYVCAAAAAKSLQSCPTLYHPIDAAHQALPSLGFSRQEHCSGLPFPSPMHESEKWKWSRSIRVSGRSPGEENGQPTGGFLPGDFHGQRSLAGYSPKGQKDLYMTEHLCIHTQTHTHKTINWISRVLVNAFCICNHFYWF